MHSKVCENLLHVLSWCWVIAVIYSLPAGIILDLDIVCGDNHTDVANVTFLTDVDYVQAVAYCENGTEVNLTPIDEFRSSILVGYPGGPDVGCQFITTYVGVEVYTITIELAHNVDGVLVQRSDDIYSLTCSFGDELDGTAHERKVDDSHVPSSSITKIKAPQKVSKVDLDVLGYDGHSFTSEIPLGKIVRLKGTLNVTIGETAPRAFHCQALSFDGIQSYDILIAGCGDGRVFPKDYGFTTVNNTAFSPYFKAFRMRGDNRIKFKCLFVTCKRPEGCNGSSCFKSTL